MTKSSHFARSFDNKSNAAPPIFARWFIVFGVFFVWAIDRYIKIAWIRDGVGIEARFIAYTQNEHSAFSIPIPQNIIIILTIIIVLGFLIYGTKLLYRRLYTDAVLVFAIIIGAFGNLFDRLLYGAVIDYIAVVLWFPIFNLSDVLVTIGLAGIFIRSVLVNKKERTV